MNRCGKGRMKTMLYRRTALAAAALLCSPALASAQQRPIVVAGAEGRFEVQLDPKTKVPGFAPAQVAAFRTQVDRLVGLLRPLPAVNSPPAPLCNRLMSWIELNPFHGVLAADVSVLSPISFENGRCHVMTGSGIFLHINALSGLLDKQKAHVLDGDGSGHWWFLPVELAGRRIIDLGDRIAFTHGRAPLLRPVSAERYLGHRLSTLPPDMESQARAQLDALTPAQRAAPACEANATGELETRPGCPDGRTLVELNPAYFDTGRPGELQLLVISTPKDRTHGENDLRMAARRAMWAALDRQALAALVR